MALSEDELEELRELPLEEEYPEDGILYPEGPQRVVEIHPPPGMDDPALAPFIELYMEKRGLKNKSQAAIKLANAMYSMGINPQRAMSNVTEYLSNMNQILESIPDNETTIPVKGALLARTATETSKLLRNTHMGESGIEQDMENMIRMGSKMKMTMKMLDTAFGEGGSETNSEVDELKRRLDVRDEQDKFTALLNPLKESLSALTDKIEKLGETPPPGPSNETTELTKALETITTRLGNMEQQSKFDQQFNGLKDEFNKVVTELAVLKKGGGNGDNQGLPEVLETLLTVREKLNSLSGEGPAGELDWRSTAISVFGETVTEGIRALKDIKVAEEKETESPSKGGASQRVVDRLVTNYCKKEIAKGNFEVKPDIIATECRITPRQAFDSVMRLRDQGLFATKDQNVRVEKIEREQGSGPGQVIEP